MRGRAAPWLAAALGATASVLLCTGGARAQGTSSADSALAACRGTPLEVVTGRSAIDARVAGKVVDADTRTALTGLVVHLGRPGGLEALTDDQGHFDLKPIPPGPYTLRVGGPGYGDQSTCVVIPSDQEVDLVVALHRRPIPLEPLDVTVQGTRPLWLVRAGFYRRMHEGGGVFITEQDIQKKDPSRLSEMFRGEAAVSIANGDPQPMQALQSTHPPPGVPGRRCPMRDPGLCRRPQDTGPCPIQFLVDGSPVPLVLGVDTFHPKDVAGIEAYFHASDIPAQFNVGRAACGVVNIWLKTHPKRPG